MSQITLPVLTHKLVVPIDDDQTAVFRWNRGKITRDNFAQYSELETELGNQYRRQMNAALTADNAAIDEAGKKGKKSPEAQRYAALFGALDTLQEKLNEAQSQDVEGADWAPIFGQVEAVGNCLKEVAKTRVKTPEELEAVFAKERADAIEANAKQCEIFGGLLAFVCNDFRVDVAGAEGEWIPATQENLGGVFDVNSLSNIWNLLQAALTAPLGKAGNTGVS